MPPKKLEDVTEFNVTSFDSNVEEYIKLVDTIAKTAASGNKLATDHRGELYILPKKVRKDVAKAKMNFRVALCSTDDIVLDDERATVDRNDKKKLSLRFHKENLYLIAYSLDGNKWYAFDDYADLLDDLVKPTKLQYDSSYGDLVQNGSKPRAEIVLGKYELGLAFENLFHARKNPNKPNRKMEANSLMRLIVMTSEAARFQCIKEFVVENFDVGRQIRPEDNEMINEWEKASTEVFEGVEWNVDPILQRAKQYVHVLLNPEYEEVAGGR